MSMQGLPDRRFVFAIRLSTTKQGLVDPAAQCKGGKFVDRHGMRNKGSVPCDRSWSWRDRDPCCGIDHRVFSACRPSSRMASVQCFVSASTTVAPQCIPAARPVPGQLSHSRPLTLLTKLNDRVSCNSADSAFDGHSTQVTPWASPPVTLDLHPGIPGVDHAALAYCFRGSPARKPPNPTRPTAVDPKRRGTSY